MNIEYSKAAIMAALEAFKTRDPERIAAMFTEDAEWLAPANNATAVALNGPSHIVGRNEIARLFGTEIWKLFTANVKGELWASTPTAMSWSSKVACAQRFRTATLTTMTIALCSRSRTG